MVAPIIALAAKVALPILKQVAVGAATSMASNAVSGNKNEQKSGGDSLLGNLLNGILGGGDKKEGGGGLLDALI